MDKLWKLALLGMMAFSFVATEVYAADEGDDDDAAEEAPKKAKKGGEEKEASGSEQGLRLDSSIRE